MQQDDDVEPPTAAGPDGVSAGLPPGPSAVTRPAGPASLGGNFRRFFVRGLGALLPTLITLWLLVWVWNFLWTSIGQHVIYGFRVVWLSLVDAGVLEPTSAGYIRRRLDYDHWDVRVLGVGSAVLIVYLVGVLVGNLIGRTFHVLAERAVMRVPLVRAIYPSVKQVTDFVLGERKSRLLAGKVVAVQARTQGVWSIGFVTGQGLRPLNDAISGDMLTIFIPSTPTAFSGYMVVAHREAVVELPLTVEETMRLILSGGVIVPPGSGASPTGPDPAYLGSHYRLAVLGAVNGAPAGVAEPFGPAAGGSPAPAGGEKPSGSAAVEPR
ncbi:MAG TPA: DUF502 domain-containing protein [Humisphaera sp.]